MKIYNIKDFGAIADGKTLATKAIQDAIDEAAENGGGKVVIEGGEYLSARIDLRSNVELHIDAGATLKATTDGEEFKEIESDFWITEMAPRRNRKCFIYAENCQNIALTGRGKIDCQGRFAVAPDEKPGLWAYKRVVFNLPARMIFFIGCKDVLCEDVLLYEPCSGWGYWICDCDRVTMRGLRIDSNRNYPNADGIHINSSRDVTVSDCDITAGDDAIVVRAYNGVLRNPKACERIAVTNCNLSSFTSCIRIAWIGDGTIRDCVFSNLTFTNSNTGIGMTIPGNPDGNPSRFTDDGGEATLIENLSFNNIAINTTFNQPIMISVADGNKINAIRNIRFSNITSYSGKFPSINMKKGVLADHVTFSGCSFTLREFDAIDGFVPRSSNIVADPKAGETPVFNGVRDLRLVGTTFSAE